MSETWCLLMRRDLGAPLPLATWPANVRVTTYGAQHAEAIHRLMALGEREGGGRVPALEVWRERFDSDPEYDPALCFIAQDEQGIVGVAQCWTSAYIKNLVVHPRAQGQGLGRALLLHAFKVFQLRREGFVDLKVLEDNQRARRLYQSAGMRVVRREEVTA
ncbi:N-acetyltransferase [Pseudomonas sp. SZMC_28357]|uniref:GNAT family N-acetyltransferase n=1 Tax=Pseudomonas sp. SZMC_28357 TaxID=3074380 RepID=UPI0028728F99|nr:N-acetyltransferase [Pseudomonas sp. SZMC_28357]MDR9754050.1 N-acetyltransferase [Pseudomonas sp. SZMC_28357]